ncbi:MAG: ubiquinol-cytochrome c reductase iron-sulfur subunit [Pseudomonadota bacterium]
MSNDQSVDIGRRHFLTVATGVTGAAGAAIAAVPFVSSMRPSARAQALGAAVEVDIGKLDMGALLKVKWRGKPIFIVKRSPEALQRLRRLEDATLRDPESLEAQQPSYAQNWHRSLREEVLVMLGSCTHLGCAPMFQPEVGAEGLGADWQGGFFCPCHGSKFDMAGRVYAGVPAPLNLVIPPYRYLSESVILIGDDTGVS